jgi:hypothetical protein
MGKKRRRKIRRKNGIGFGMEQRRRKTCLL